MAYGLHRRLFSKSAVGFRMSVVTLALASNAACFEILPVAGLTIALVMTSFDRSTSLVIGPQDGHRWEGIIVLWYFLFWMQLPLTMYKLDVAGMMYVFGWAVTSFHPGDKDDDGEPVFTKLKKGLKELAKPSDLAPNPG